MTLDAATAERLIAFCSRLPELPAEGGIAESEMRFALGVFDRRLRAVREELLRFTSGPELAELRSEAEALNCVPRVLGAVWRRRFGDEPPAVAEKT